MKVKGLCIIGALTFALAGCNGGGDKPTTQTTTSTGASSPSGESSSTGGAPQASQGALTKLEKTDVKIGTGPVLEDGDTAHVIYTGTLKDGTEFDSNTSPEKPPLIFQLGQGQMIKGFDQGLGGMRVGGERKLAVPAELGYGSQVKEGSGIPPNSDLYFTVKLVGVVKVGEERVIDTKDLKVGTGKEAKDGSTVTIDYVGKLLNGTEFDSSKTKGPATFTIGKKQASTGMEEGVKGMKVGGKRRVQMPPDVVGQVPQNVRPGSILVYEIELKAVK